MHGVRVRRVPGKPATAADWWRTKAASRAARGFLRVPASPTLSPVTVRNLRSNHHSVGEHLKKLYGADPERALAIFLLHEWLKEHMGEGSKWGPYLRTLRSPAMGRAALRAMAGTYASEVHRSTRGRDPRRGRHPVRHLPPGLGFVQTQAGRSGSGRTPGTIFGGRWASSARARFGCGNAQPAPRSWRSSPSWTWCRTTRARAARRSWSWTAPSRRRGRRRARGRGDGHRQGGRGVTDAESLCRWHHVTPGPNDANGVRPEAARRGGHGGGGAQEGAAPAAVAQGAMPPPRRGPVARRRRRWASTAAATRSLRR